MFRPIVSIFLLTLFSLQTFQQGLIVLDYYINTAAFEKACINKARPQLACKGKCGMMKKMAEEEESEKKQPARKLDAKSEIFTSPLSMLLPVGVPVALQRFVAVPLLGREVNRPRSLLRPPIG